MSALPVACKCEAFCLKFTFRLISSQNRQVRQVNAQGEITWSQSSVSRHEIVSRPTKSPPFTAQDLAASEKCPEP